MRSRGSSGGGSWRWYSSGAAATNPAAARRRAIPCTNWSTPPACWIIRTPGALSAAAGSVGRATKVRIAAPFTFRVSQSLLWGIMLSA